MAVQTAPDLVHAVSSVGAFGDLSAATREAIAGISSLRRYRKDGYIFIEGDESEFLCFLHDGVVRTFRTTALGAEQTLQIVRPGEIFALTGFLGRDAYSSTAQTLEDSWVGFVRNDALRALVQRSADLGWVLLKVFGQRLRDQSRQMVELSTRDASAKIAATLLRLAEHEGSGPQARLHFTHRELAQLVGCSRETVTRVLREFREDQSVEQADDGRLIVHPTRLQAYAN